MNRITVPTGWMAQLFEGPILTSISSVIKAAVVAGRPATSFGLMVIRNNQTMFATFDPDKAPKRYAAVVDGVLVAVVPFNVVPRVRKVLAPALDLFEELPPPDSTDLHVLIVDGDDYFVGGAWKDFGFSGVIDLSGDDVAKHPATRIANAIIDENLSRLRECVKTDIHRLGVPAEELVYYIAVVIQEGLVATLEQFTASEKAQLEVRVMKKEEAKELVSLEFPNVADGFNKPADPGMFRLLFHGVDLFLQRSVTVDPLVMSAGGDA